jgi:alpha-galactosidase
VLAGAFALAGVRAPHARAGAATPYGVPTPRAPLTPHARLAPTPPMGWSSWYYFGCEINEALMKRTADALVHNGMAAAGYRFVNIDDCWMRHKRDAAGNLIPSPTRFPGGIDGLASYVHALGLKLGIYLDTGDKTCTGFAGSQGHFRQDAQAIAAWQIDYLKLDFCRSRPAAPKPIYARFHKELNETGRPILLNICEWGYQEPWRWGPGIGSTWRTTGDYFSYGAPRNYWKAILKIATLNADLASYARPGAWNDPNALLVGTRVLTVAEERSQMSLWSMLAAPLIAGGELSTASRATLDVLLNREVIAVDQDRAGIQGERAIHDGTAQVWVRRLEDGSRAVLLLNESARPATITADLKSLGLTVRSGYLARDLWAHKSRIIHGDSLSAQVGGHDVAMLRLRVPSSSPPKPRAHRPGPTGGRPSPPAPGGAGSTASGAGTTTR